MVSSFYYPANLVTNIFLYSRLNPLITIHQISEDLPLSWLDTPIQLPLPRNDLGLPPMSANLGLVIMPSNVILNAEDVPRPEDFSITTYKLQPDLSIVGDMYGTRESEVESFTVKPYVTRTETLSPRLSNADHDIEADEKWTPYQSNWQVDFSRIAAEVISSRSSENLMEKTAPELRGEILGHIEESDFQYETM